MQTIPRIPLGDTIEAGLDAFIEFSSGATRALSALMDTGITAVEHGLLWLHPVALIAIFTLCAWQASRKWGFPLFTALGFGLILNMGFWNAAINTLALVFCAALLAIMLGIPIGLCAAIFPRLEKALAPVLDIMQTMPSFVYLIPAIPLFGLGKVAALFATLVFSVPPAIRMTCLGIRQIPPELVECAEAFGSTRWQRLLKLELPLAAPTILAGVNQTVLLSLSMTVIAAMIGARGLGGEVWRAIQRLDIGLGFEAGLGIVILAIFLDRLLRLLGTRFSRHTP